MVGGGVVTKRFERLDAAIDEASYQWLADELPGIAEAVAAEVAAGVDAHDIRLRVQDRTGRRELALRCEQAARFLGRDG